MQLKFPIADKFPTNFFSYFQTGNASLWEIHFEEQLLRTETKTVAVEIIST